MAANTIFLSGKTPILSAAQKEISRISRKENSARAKLHKSGPVVVIFSSKKTAAK
jgi:malonyl CoA-acyl carrier protein transacylase